MEMVSMTNENDFLANVSLVLGKMHGALVIILNSNDDALVKINKLKDLETGLRQEINRLYYPLIPHIQHTDS